MSCSIWCWALRWCKIAGIVLSILSSALWRVYSNVCKASAAGFSSCRSKSPWNSSGPLSVYALTSYESRCQRERLEVCEWKVFDYFTEKFQRNGNPGESFDNAIVVDSGQGKGVGSGKRTASPNFTLPKKVPCQLVSRSQTNKIRKSFLYLYLSTTYSYTRQH